MSRYLLIASRDPFAHNDVGRFYGLARGLAEQGHEVRLFLVQNGVLPARPCSLSGQLSDLAGAGVQVLADDFSLRERGIAADALAAGIQAAPLETVIDELEVGAKTLWN